MKLKSLAHFHNGQGQKFNVCFVQLFFQFHSMCPNNGTVRHLQEINIGIALVADNAVHLDISNFWIHNGGPGLIVLQNHNFLFKRLGFFKQIQIRKLKHFIAKCFFDITEFSIQYLLYKSHVFYIIRFRNIISCQFFGTLCKTQDKKVSLVAVCF